MNKKSILALAIALMMLFSLSINAFAFSDIKDEKTAAAVNVLQSLGVINGFPDGTFKPDETLTRAQFTKMAVSLKQGIDSELALAGGRTIFPDVKSNHWAIAFINYASDSKNKIVSGYPDGLFHPDDNIKYCEAVTILMRMLGYSDADVGMVWPDGYMNAAAVCGLTEGLELENEAGFSRGNAALLFNNMLNCNLKSGSKNFLSTICTGGMVENVVLLDNNATAADGTKGALRVLKDGTEVVYKTTAIVSDNAINKVITLALDEDGAAKVVMVKGEANCKLFTLSSATSTLMRGTDGTEIGIVAGLKVIYNGTETEYSRLYLDLRAGAAVKVYYNAAGNIQKLYIDTAKGDKAAVITTAFAENSNPFIALLGLNENTEYTIIKDGGVADASALELYDTAIFDEHNKTIYVSSLKISGVYEDVKGDYSNPTEIYILGNWFEVAPCAQETVTGFKPSADTLVTVALTADNRIAGMFTQRQTFTSAIGVASSSGSFTLPDGTVLSGSSTNGSAFEGRLATAYGKEAGKITFRELSLQKSTEDFDIAAGKVGDAELAAGVVMYDSIKGNAIRQIKAEDITSATVAAEKIWHIGYDKMGRVNLFVFNDITGDCYTYGKIKVNNGSISIGGKTIQTYQSYTDGEYCGVAVGPSGFADGYIKMHQLKNFTTADFLNDRQLLLGNKIYTVASNAVVYLEPMQKYVSLYEARSYGGKVEAYYDDVVGKLRVIIVKAE